MTDSDRVVETLRAVLAKRRRRSQVRTWLTYTALGIAAGWAALGLGASVWEWLR